MKKITSLSLGGLLSAMSGGLLFLSDYPVHFWPVQLVALLPWMIALHKFCASKWQALGLGFFLGCAYVVPLLIALEFPVLMGAGLGLYQVLLWVLISFFCFLIRQWQWVWRMIGFGAVFVLIEWVDVSVVPVWGTAQCFARVWSACPLGIQFVSWTGVLGLVWVLVFFQAGLLGLWLHHGKRLFTLAELIGVVLLIGAYGLFSSKTTDNSITVAAVGWNWEHLPDGAQTKAEAVWNLWIKPGLQRAAEQEAKLVVTPEVGLWPDENERLRIFQEASEWSKAQKIWLAIGYFSREMNDNRIAFFDPQGELAHEYRKTHLIPFVENYNAGDGSLTMVDRGLIGGMICQDDNFTDLSRGYGREGVRVMAVPTNDWRQVRLYHLENSIFRAVESRYGIVRAASNGVSAIISPSGRVLASKDHFKEGPGVIVADLPIVDNGSAYSLWGDWLMVGFAAVSLLIGLSIKRIGHRVKSPTSML